MKTKLLYILALLILFVCCSKSVVKKIELKLTSSSIENISTQDFRLNEKILYSYENQYPNLYKEKIKRFKNKPRLDSFKILSNSLHYLPKAFYSRKFGDTKYKPIYGMTKEDSIYLENNNLKYEINALSGFSGNKQIVIIDANNNYDFSDDEKLIFDINIRKQSKSNNRSHSESQVFNYEVIEKGKKHNIEKNIIAYPNINHKYIYLLLNGTIDSIINQYSVEVKFLDLKISDFSIKGEKYKVFVEGFNNQTSSVIIKQDSIINNLSKTELQNYIYKNKDTVKIDNIFFKIFLSENLKKIKLEPIEVKNNKGYKIGFDSKNILTKNILTNKKIELEELVKKKDYTLIDFWGTWCLPCIKITPDLKSLNNDFSDKLSILSIAYDKNQQNVIDYITKKKLDWNHAYVKQRGNIEEIKPIRDFNINSFPTLILLNRKNQIIYRGGSQDVNRIRSILEN